MKKNTVALLLATLVCANAQADTLLGLYIGGQVWDVQTEGSFGELNNQVAFDFKDQQQGSYFIALEHPIPLVPNIKIASTTLDTTGLATLSKDFEFGGIVFPISTTVEADLALSYIDYTFYYEIFDNDLLTLDLGISARDYELSATVTETLTNSDSNLISDELIPMLYISTIIGLPLTGLNFFGEANFITYDDQTVYDYQLGVSYELLDNVAVDLDINLGYRSVTVELNDISDIYTDLTYSGVFAGAVVHF